MIWKRRLSLSISLLIALVLLSILKLNTLRVSALDYPAMYITPAAVRTPDPVSANGVNYTFSVYTDYSGSDIWGYEFDLIFDPDVIECVEFVNGELITIDTSLIEWRPGTINNTIGTLSVTGCTFWAAWPNEPAVTSGPGILANVTFMVVGHGISNITLGDGTRLMRWHEDPNQRDIINTSMMGDHIGDGILYNLFPGDIDDDLDCDYDDFNAFAAAYLKTSAHSGYDPLADFDLDGDVDYDDFNTFAANYLKTFP